MEEEHLHYQVLELEADEGKLYLFPIKGLFSGEIITYDVATRPDFEQIR